MKITVWGINYDPEPTGIGPFNTDLCKYLAGRGHDVVMLTSFAYYPWWKKQAADRGKLFEQKIMEGVRVQRCWHFVPARPSTWTRLIHELTFVVSSTWRALWLRRPDVMIVVSPPLFLGLGAYLVSRLKRTPCVFHVQDLQPDAALGLGMITPGLAVRTLFFLEKRNYQMAALVSGISEGMMVAYRRKGVPERKIYLFPNWIPDGNEETARSGRVSFRTTHGLRPTEPLIAYSGNVGMKQGLEVVVEAAALDTNGGSAEPNFHWSVCGEGAAKPALELLIRETGCKGVTLYPLQPDDLYHSLLREADISLITQQHGAGQFFFPSKLLSILQYGRPVLAVADADSELARAVTQGEFGIVVLPGDAGGLLAAARSMVSASPRQRAEWAQRGHAWVDQFRRSKVLLAFEEKLKALLAEAS